MGCTHLSDEQLEAALAPDDVNCPLCLRAEIARLREALERQVKNGYYEPQATENAARALAASPAPSELKVGDVVIDTGVDELGEGVITAADDGRGSCRVAWSDGGLYDVATKRLRHKPAPSEKTCSECGDKPWARMICPMCSETK